MAETIVVEGAPKKRSKFLEALGPGLITGASDDDPSGIATYSQAGRAVRLRPRLDPAAHISADGGDPAHQRAHRAGHRPRHRRQYPALLLTSLLYPLVAW
jgi:hypothetical protein